MSVLQDASPQAPGARAHLANQPNPSSEAATPPLPPAANSDQRTHA